MKVVTNFVIRHTDEQKNIAKVSYEEEFFKEIKDLFTEMINISIPVAESYDPEEDVDFIRDYCSEILDHIEQGVTSSPTSYFIDWKNSTIGEVSLYNIGVDMMARFRKLRLSPLLMILEKNIKFAAKWN